MKKSSMRATPSADLFIGLDVHKDTIDIAFAEEWRWLGGPPPRDQ